MDAAIPRRWILVAPQVGVPTEETSSGVLSLDVLYVDQDGIPTLVEIKRATDIRLRREVVAQMLDYAANAVAYWPPENLRNRFEERLKIEGKAPDSELVKALGIDQTDIDDFWQKVASNLRSGRIRMLFVADVIPAELKRIVEFLNIQMNPAMVLALELRQFTGGDVKTFVPVVFGQTQRAIQEKGISKSRENLTEEDFYKKFEDETNAAITKLVREVIESAVGVGFTTRLTSMSLFIRYLNKEGELIEPFAIRTDGLIELYLGDKYMRSPFDADERRKELRQKFEAIRGLSFTKSPQYPKTSLSNLSPGSAADIRNVLSWIKDQVIQADVG
jgi:hypothetical protein